ncbi:MAG TPA: hypothetical protein VFC06_07250 [Demequina sp.]|nr:hypothetical protein [Demequina sp.]
MTTVPATASIREQVLQALDPDGRMQRAIEVARHLPADARSEELRRVAAEYEENITVVERYWEPLTERGWGIANVGLQVIRRAGALLDANDASASDKAIALWFDAEWIARIIARVGILQDGTPDGREAFEQRQRLLKQAAHHHLAGDYAASILIVLSQIEGITAQVTAPPEGGPGRLFFSKRANRKAYVVDPTDLASIQASLDRLRDLYSDDVTQVQADGSWGRHGIAHGQEVAFDTEVNSSKYWSLLDVVVQWAMPRAHERSLKIDALRASPHTGSQDVDERGRRLDDREFKVTRNALYEVCSHQSAWARRAKHFDARATDGLITNDAMEKRGLPPPHGVTIHTADDGSAFWAERQTVSGWWLARGLTLNELGLVDVWYYSGQDGPSSGPSEDPEQWGGQPNFAPPDWQGA